MSLPGGRLLRRLSWSLVDQVVSSLTNVVLSVVVARSVDADQFGAFAVAFTVYSIVVQAVRGLTGQPLWMRFGDSTPSEYRVASRASIGASLLAGAAIGLFCAGVGFLLGGSVGVSLIALGAVMPALLLQDAWRMVLFGRLRPAAAALNDCVWGVVQVVLIGGLLILHRHSAAAVLVAWGVSAGVAAIVGVAQTGWLPSFGSAWNFVRQHWDITGFLVAELLILQGGAQGAVLVVGALGVVADVGSFRAAMVLLGPVAIIGMGVNAFGVPELARHPGMRSAARLRIALLISTGLMVVSAVWGIVALTLPFDLGRAFLGDTWSGAQSVLPLTLIQQLGLLAAVGPGLMCYSMAKTRETFRVHVLLSILTLIGGVVGVEVHGVRGAAAGFAVAAWLVVPVWWTKLAQLARENETSTAAGTDPVPVGSSPPTGAPA